MNSASGLQWTTRYKGIVQVSSPRGIDAADLNADGRPELIVGQSRRRNSVTVFIASALVAGV